MSAQISVDNAEVGYNIPAVVGMAEHDIQTPCLIVDLDAFERNVMKMRHICEDMGVRHRVHGKMHRSVDVALYQIEQGRACGVCCQKVSEAEAFVRGGIKDVLITNQIRDPAKINRLASLPKQARTIVCIDDHDNVAELSEAAVRHGTTLEVLVEIECGAGRCGVDSGQPVVSLAQAIDAAAGLKFSGIHCYQGAAQHLPEYEARRKAIDAVIAMARESLQMLADIGLSCDIVGGAGTGTYYFEGGSGVYNEMQCGSYAFMDADYQRVLNEDGDPISEFDNALFILTSIMSTARPGKAVCDAGLKSQSVDSGLPVIYGCDDLEYIGCSDDHGIIVDSGNRLKVNDRLKLIPGHCDPTCNIHDWYVGVRNGMVEVMWPVSARGMSF